MRIGKVYVENVRRCQVVDVDLAGNGITIGGSNEQGKSSFLDGLFYALLGKGAQCEQPIRKGKNKARIELELVAEDGDAYKDLIVTRTITHKTNSIAISSRDGATYGSPQKLLDKLAGPMFAMEEFSELKPDKQRQILIQLDPEADPTELDNQWRGLYDERGEINRVGKNLVTFRDAIEFQSGVPEQEISILELSGKIQEGQTKVHAHDSMVDKHRSVEDSIQKILTDIQDIEARLKTLRAQREALNEDAEAMAKQIEENEKELPDIANLQAAMEAADEINAKVRTNATRQQHVTKIEALRKQREEIQVKMDANRAAKDAKMQAAKFPVPGLAITEDGITYNDLPFSRDQLSSAELLRVCIAIGAAMARGLKAMVIKEGCRFDAEHRKIARRIAEEYGVQLVMEIVGNGDKGECKLIMQQGQAVAND